MLETPDEVIERWFTLLRPGGRIVLLDAARSSRMLAFPLDAAFRTFVAAIALSTKKLRDDPATRLTERVAAARHPIANQPNSLFQKVWLVRTAASSQYNWLGQY